jgi:hypothetical protein
LNALVAQYAGDADPYQRKLYGDSLHASLTVEEVRELIDVVGLGGAVVARTSDRHWSIEVPAPG